MEKKSPLTAKPLRYPGQSLQEELDKLVDDQVIPYFIASAVLIVLAFNEWVRYFQDSRPQPEIMSIAAVLMLVVAFSKLIKLKKKAKNLKQGRDGEKAVGQYMELLREEGCIVFHDILGDQFNIDHVVISEKGIYCIETKTYSKPDIKEPTVRFAEGNLDIDGLGRKNEILKQVQAASSWLKETLKETTGLDLEVKPVVLFPGWWIESKGFQETWVLNPKGFPKYLSQQPDKVPPDIKKMIGFHLGRYIRAL